MITDAETTVMRTEIARVMTRAHPPMIMSLQDVADFFGLSYNYVRNELQHDPEFPKRLARFKQPRYSRTDVTAYAQVRA